MDDPSRTPTIFRGGDQIVVEGLDGWLFLREYHGVDVMRLHTDPDAIPPSVYRRWAEVLRRRREHFAEANIDYLTLVVPDSVVVYPDKLPPDVVPAALSPYERLSATLDEETRNQCVYPREVLIRGRETGPTFQRTDSHWTDFGAYLGYRATVDRLAVDRPGLPVVEPDGVVWTSRRSFGALGAATTPERSEVLDVARVADDRTRLTPSVITHVRDAYTVVEQDRPELPSAVIFRDSAMTAAAKFFSQSFRRVSYCTSPNAVFYDLVERERPDVVIHEVGERRLARAPSEPTTHEFRHNFGDLLLDDPAAVAHQRSARTHLDSGRPAEALAASNDALRVSSPTSRMLVFRSRAYRALDEPEAALAVLEQAAALDPIDGAPHFERGELLGESGDLPAAATAYAKAAVLEPRHRLYWAKAIDAAVRAGNPKLAVALSADAVTHLPTSADLWYARACALTALATPEGRAELEEAADAAARACRLEPGRALFTRQLASTLVRQQRWADAERILVKLDADEPGQPAIVAGLAHVRARLGPDHGDPNRKEAAC